MTTPDNLRDLLAHHVQERVRLRLGPNALGMAALGESVMLSGVEADLVGQAVVDALAGAGLVVVSVEDLRTYLDKSTADYKTAWDACTRLRAALPERTGRS